MSIYTHPSLKEANIAASDLSSWITYSDSLTDKLRRLTSSVELKRLRQAWVGPSWWDKYALNIQAGLLFQREIIMYADGAPYWYARTLIPQACYEQNPLFFRRLEQESLRNLIFEGGEVHRLQFKAYPIDKTCIEYYWVKQYLPVAEKLWLRMSEYAYREKAFYLMEILFPELGELSL